VLLFLYLSTRRYNLRSKRARGLFRRRVPRVHAYPRRRASLRATEWRGGAISHGAFNKSPALPFSEARVKGLPLFRLLSPFGKYPITTGLTPLVHRRDPASLLRPALNLHLSVRGDRLTLIIVGTWSRFKGVRTLSGRALGSLVRARREFTLRVRVLPWRLSSRRRKARCQGEVIESRERCNETFLARRGLVF